MLIYAIISISLALVFYTIGVFGERRSHELKKWHVITFWLGLICDTTGTYLMSLIAKNQAVGTTDLTPFIHGATGALAIILMIFHAVWATVVISKNDTKKKETFHKFSLFVWLVWLVPYVIGMIIGMM